MEALKKPIWLVIATLLPQLLLLLLFKQAYDIVGSLLDPEEHQLWISFAWYYGIICFLYISYAANLFVQKQGIHVYAAWALALIQFANIGLYFIFHSEAMPRSIPNWMLTSSDLEVYPYSFMIPGALYALILLVLHYTPQPEKKDASINLVPVLLAPIAIMILVTTFGVTSYDRSRILLFKHLPTFVMLFFVSVFVFYVMRMIYVSVSRRNAKGKAKGFGTVSKVLFSFLFPLIGLWVSSAVEGEIFGDFSHPAFFVLAALNGLVMSLKNPKKVWGRWLFFVLRAIFSAYILYFSLIFLPYLPISLVAIIALGFGFVMLSPIIAMLLQVSELRKDIQFLQTVASKKLIYLTLVLSVFVLPTIITINYQLDRLAIDRMLDFVHQRDFNDDDREHFDADRSSKLLERIRGSEQSWRTKETPFLDNYYKWLVLDNLTLSNRKRSELYALFVGSDEPPRNRLWTLRTVPPPRGATLHQHQVESRFNGSHWTSYIHMDIVNYEQFQSEFRVLLETPPGCFVSNYYLDIEGRREYGLLAEKRSANWVYNNIVNTRRDPGFLSMVGENTYQLKVFPVGSNAHRTTGIEFVHKEPIAVQLGDTSVFLGDSASLQTAASEVLSGTGLFVPTKAKQALLKTQRKPAYHILVDRSASSNLNVAKATSLVSSLQKKLPSSESFDVWAVNYEGYRSPSDNWQTHLDRAEEVGGFFPEYTMKKILARSYEKNSTTCPVFILVTGNMLGTVFLEGFSDLTFTVPDMPRYYVFSQSENLFAFDLESTKSLVSDPVDPHSVQPDSMYVKSWKDRQWYLPMDENPQVLLTDQPSSGSTAWEKGLMLQRKQQYYALHPEEDDLWLSIVQNSMSSGILTAFTSYISLENEAQKQALLAKQDQVLNGNQNFDVSDTPEMSEPSIWWYVLALLLFGLFSVRKRVERESRF